MTVYQLPVNATLTWKQIECTCGRQTLQKEGNVVVVFEPHQSAIIKVKQNKNKNKNGSHLPPPPTRFTRFFYLENGGQIPDTHTHTFPIKNGRTSIIDMQRLTLCRAYLVGQHLWQSTLSDERVHIFPVQEYGHVMLDGIV